MQPCATRSVAETTAAVILRLAWAIKALADEPGGVVVSTSAPDPAGFAAPHERVRITRFLPHAAVIPRVDVVVTHGGTGATQRAPGPSVRTDHERHRDPGEERA